jgi:4a-hydroxytetrahydrobiopterin dehydratase
MALLGESEVSRHMAHQPAWQLEGDTIVQTLVFPDFVAAMAFVNRVAAAAETAGHHPDIDIRWNKVRLALSSHDAGGLTEKDFSLATVIDTLIAV